MTKVKEIQTALTEMEAAMVEKGIKTPAAEMQIRANQKCNIHGGCGYSGGAPFDGDNYFIEFGDTPADAIAKAFAYIAAMPSPDEAGVQEYMRDVAKAIDTGKRHNIADEYVAPLRVVKAAMTDNLLAHSKEAGQ